MRASDDHQPAGVPRGQAAGPGRFPHNSTATRVTAAITAKAAPRNHRSRDTVGFPRTTGLSHGGERCLGC